MQGQRVFCKLTNVHVHLPLSTYTVKTKWGLAGKKNVAPQLYQCFESLQGTSLDFIFGLNSSDSCSCVPAVGENDNLRNLIKTLLVEGTVWVHGGKII